MQAAAPAPLAADDPRMAWEARNRAERTQREAVEAQKKAAALNAAKEHLAGVAKAREAQLAQRRKANREAEAIAGVLLCYFPFWGAVGYSM
jgi:hypothetical protein